MRSGMVKMSLHFSLGNSRSGCSPLYIEASLQTSNSDEPSPVLDSEDTEESPHRVHNLVGGAEQAACVLQVMLGNEKAPGGGGQRKYAEFTNDGGCRTGWCVKAREREPSGGARGVRAPR